MGKAQTRVFVVPRFFLAVPGFPSALVYESQRLDSHAICAGTYPRTFFFLAVPILCKDRFSWLYQPMRGMIRFFLAVPTSLYLPDRFDQPVDQPSRGRAAGIA